MKRIVGICLLLGVISVWLFHTVSATKQAWREEVATYQATIDELEQEKALNTNQSVVIEEKEIDRLEEVERVVEAFLPAYFTYVSYEEREKAVKPLITKTLYETLGLSVYNENEQVHSTLLQEEVFVKKITEKKGEALTALQVFTDLNNVEATMYLTYKLTVEQEQGIWQVSGMEFLGSRME